MPLPPASFEILVALAGGERHGYAIMQEVAERTGGAVRLGPGTLYGSLKRLLADELVVEASGPAKADSGDERRRYYRLTSLGLAVARAEARRMEAMVRAARRKRLLSGNPA
ncbi:MAG: PadR family transcriptional regulator [Gemmatimonadaceae bacterium]